MHFVDFEVIRRMRRSWVELTPRLQEVVQLLALVSPEPPLFPISAVHEHNEIGALLNELDPHLDAGHVRVAGSGPSPWAYLESRREQFEGRRGYFEPLFGAHDEALFGRAAAVWEERSGGATELIAASWGAKVEEGAGGILRLASRAGKPKKWQETVILELPSLILGQPLIADVVSDELIRRGALSEDLRSSAQIELAAFLTSRWAEIYAQAYSAALLSDLGPRLSNHGPLRPSSGQLVSASAAFDLLAILGVQDVCRSEPRRFAYALSELANVRVLFAADVFRRLGAGAGLWRDEHEAAAISKWVGRGDRTFVSLAHVAQRLVRRETLVSRLDRAISGYLDAIGSAGYSRSMAERSINIQSAGFVQVAQDGGSNHASGVFVSERASGLADQLLTATESAANEEALLRQLSSGSQSALPPAGELQRALEQRVPDPEARPAVRQRLLVLAAKLGQATATAGLGALVSEAVTGMLGG